MSKWSKKDVLRQLAILEKSLSQLRSEKNTFGKSIIIVEKSFFKLIKHLSSASKFFMTPSYKISQLSRFLATEIKPICSRVFRVTSEILSLYISLRRIDYLISSIKMLNDCGCGDEAKKLFNLLLEHLDDYVNLADLIDKALECGFLDIALKGLRKLRKKGYSFFEIDYNEALVNYLCGNDMEALKIAETAIKKYGPRKQLLGLLSAIYIAIGHFEKSKEILSTLRYRS